MSDRRIICVSCGTEIQRNTPLEQGGTLLAVPGVCPDCEKPAQGATVGHELSILGLGGYPAAICSCKAWAYTMTHKAGGTRESKLAALVAAHNRHLNEVET